MNLDLGTLSGLLGVVLTIVFFVIGYRQTIGARKERAGAANREIIETLLRRFTLDADFVLQFDEIERFVVGKALDSRVKRSDVYLMDDIFPLLYSRVVSSDYVAGKKRKIVLEKINRCFKRPSAGDDTFVVLAAAREEEKRKLSVEVTLGLVSALMAAGVSLSADLVVTGWAERLSAPSVRFALGMALGVSAVTAVALVGYVRLRDKASTTKPDTGSSTVASRAQEFEARLLERLRVLGVQFDQKRDVDLIISIKQKRIAIELKLFTTPSLGNLRSALNQLRHIISKYECDEAYLVLSAPPSERVRSMGDDQVRILGVDEFLGFVTSPEPIRGLQNL
jgi:hypothetical protein